MLEILKNLSFCTPTFSYFIKSSTPFLLVQKQSPQEPQLQLACNLCGKQSAIVAAGGAPLLRIRAGCPVECMLSALPCRWAAGSGSPKKVSPLFALPWFSLLPPPSLCEFVCASAPGAWPSPKKNFSFRNRIHIGSPHYLALKLRKLPPWSQG